MSDGITESRRGTYFTDKTKYVETIEIPTVVAKLSIWKKLINILKRK